jgi:hypothetical protein
MANYALVRENNALSLINIEAKTYETILKDIKSPGSYRSIVADYDQ